MNKVLDKALADIFKHGPDRVITTWDGGSVPYKNAVEEYDIDVEIIFIRDDGWTLGCHRSMLTPAYHLWREDWIAVLLKGEETPIDINEFVSLGKEATKRLPPMAPLHKRIPQPKFRKGFRR